MSRTLLQVGPVGSLERSALHLELTNVNKYRLDEINKIKEYFDNEIKERKDIIKKINKYLVSFDYLDKYLLLYQHHLVR